MNKNLILSGIVVTAFLVSGCGKHEDQSVVSLESDDMAEDMNSTLSNEVVLIPQDQAQQVSDETNPVTATTVSGSEIVVARDPSLPFVKPTDQEVQQSLKNAGLYNGQVDGVTGPRTKKAIRDFQDQHNLTADGRVGPQTWAKLEPFLHQSQGAVAAPSAAPKAKHDIDN